MAELNQELLRTFDEQCTNEHQLSDLKVVLKGAEGLVVRVVYSPAGTTFTFSMAELP